MTIEITFVQTFSYLHLVVISHHDTPADAYGEEYANKTRQATALNKLGFPKYGGDKIHFSIAVPTRLHLFSLAC